MRYKAIFFDRYGTLTRNDAGWECLRDEKLSEWSGQDFVFTQELFDLIDRTVERKDKWTIHSLKEIIDFAEGLK